mgnify:CR=1 FL=1|tara:strand:+ start:952 stop:1461 length:510 start_codon:yes stop_codon:yes gene_type:complete
MSLYKNNSGYSKIAKLFHWGFVLLFVYGVAKQVDDINQLEDAAFIRFEIIFSLIFLFLLITRLIYMKTTQKSSLPKDTPRVQKMSAKIVHNGMYAFLAGTVLSGLLIGYLFWFGFQNSLMMNIVITLHELFINLLYLLIGIHIFAATFHRLKKDGVWSSMVPIFKENKK